MRIALRKPPVRSYCLV